jgi:uncharacterized iron-regulated membrane protein
VKSKQFRDVVFIAHRYTGLVVGILVAAIALTGSLLNLHVVCDKLTLRVSPIGESLAETFHERLPIEVIIAKAKEIYPTLSVSSLSMPTSSTEPITVSIGENIVHINPYTGTMVGQPTTGHYTNLLYSIHINLLGGEWGAYVAGIVGLLATILCVTGIVLWPAWRKLTTGFKIKWNASQKRLNFDLHKVVGIITATFLILAMGTGFLWNFGEWTNPIIYAMTLSPQSVEEAKEPVSKLIVNQPKIAFTEDLLQKAIAALPGGEVRYISLPDTPEGVFNIRKELPHNIWASVLLDQYSGEIIEVGSTTQSLGDKLIESFPIVHYGTFAGTYSRIFYIFVGLAPAILLTTGFIMWWHRRQPVKLQKMPHDTHELIKS